MRAVEFVSGISRHFRLASMLAKERYVCAYISDCLVYSLLFIIVIGGYMYCSVKQRLDSEEGMSCAEFLYPIFQSYDFLQLHKKANCWIQVGVRIYVQTQHTHNTHTQHNTQYTYNTTHIQQHTHTYTQHAYNITHIHALLM